MSELVEFLRAQLDKDEAWARVAVAPEWEVEPANPHRVRVVPAGDTGDLIAYIAYAPGGEGPHIARHDPKRAVAEVAGKRKLLDKYERLLASQRAHERAVAELDAGIAQEEKTGRWEGVGSPDVRQRALRREADYLAAMRPILEEVLVAAAAVYAGEPGYRDEWRP